ncbi:MAG: methylated-DNA--[protein]-cysteine S-methyltransferase [Balneolales bacterium]
MKDYHRIEKAIEFIKVNFKEQPSLETIARVVDMGPYHFQRVFTEWAGVSPKKFVQYLSLEYAKKILKNGTVYDAAYETGLSGTGRLHDLFVGIEAMTPGEFKNSGENLRINYSFQTCVFGNYTVASTDKGICNLFFIDQDQDAAVRQLQGQWANAVLTQGADEHHVQVKRFFDGELEEDETIRLHLKGTKFQLKVWEALLRIPEGALVSYSDISKDIQMAKAQRSVGSAIGRNPVGFIIPCHRVIKGTGVIGDYRWGSSRKLAMIGREAARSK